ncbi:RNA-binding protein NOB1 [Gracilaria domingensis]|nr:RNA-binding protein NOB1 [Gracilaria domingensis]
MTTTTRAEKEGPTRGGNLFTSPYTMSPKEPEGLIVVLDSAALIAGTDSLFSLGGLVSTETGDSLYSASSEAKVRFFSVPEVFREIRDPRARARLALLQDSITLRAPSSEVMAETIDFAKRTGDFSVLSLTDLKVIALTRMLEREENGDKFLKTAPTQRHVSEVRIGELFHLKFWTK